MRMRGIYPFVDSKLLVLPPIRQRQLNNGAPELINGARWPIMGGQGTTRPWARVYAPAQVWLSITWLKGISYGIGLVLIVLARA